MIVMIENIKLRVCIALLLMLCNVLVYSQNAFLSADGWGNGWNTNDYWEGTGFGSTFGKIYQNTAGAGNRYFRLLTDWSGQTREHGPEGNTDIQVFLSTPFALTTVGQGKAYYIDVNNSSDYFVFRTRFGDGISNPAELIVFKIEGPIQTVTDVSQWPDKSIVYDTSSVHITAETSGNLSPGQGLYLRYSTDNWTSSSIIQMSNSGNGFSATIPAQSSGTTVNYYVFTSGDGLTIQHQDADFYTINGNTNQGTNYEYSVLPHNTAVSISPAYPSDQELVTITFDASGTPLSGLPKIYMHAGVAINKIAPKSFMHVVGNWGVDDGVGEMQNMGSDLWSITLPSIRTYFNVPEEEDIFAINLLFRNVDGSIKEDFNGINYYFATNPGKYFVIDEPVRYTQFEQTGQDVALSCHSETGIATWMLQEIDITDGHVIDSITTIAGVESFNYSIPVTAIGLKKYKIFADFGTVVKYKTFQIYGYDPIVNAPRPSWVKQGINYHSDDSTKATLVLHTPVFTQYKKGNGTLSGENTSHAKNVVFVIGDFNNWQPSEAFKMFRDRDGWDGTIDSDGDNDHGDYWWIELSGLVPGQEYVFQYLVDGAIQIADPYTYKVSDPDDDFISPDIYPDLVDYPSGAVDRASVLQTMDSSFIWTADPFTKPSDNNLNVYELHFRDFTEEGTYRAATEKLDYLKGLGINAIHVMPVSEFEGNDSWGYNPNFYFAADKAYGTADDLKRFIDACHQHKILVFNDLVLNHAFYSNVMAKLYWNQSLNQPADDNPWFNPKHKMIADPAGWWGADWNHESVHTQKMVDRILDYWMTEFNFDGFRFDFTKGFGQTAPNPSDPWASNYNQDRIDLLMRMVNVLKTNHPEAVVIFEHLAQASEDKVLADNGILMWSGVEHHNNVKGLVLGYNSDNTNIYDSGVYNAPGRNFIYANWMSYAESHDEERLGYELSQYFNGNKTIENVIKRLKMGLSFNLLLPGPRMLWQFQELGYDFSINYNGRTGRKPVRWDYYDDPNRQELYTLTSRIFKLRNRFPIYSNSPDYGNIGLGSGNIHIPRVMRLSSGSGPGAKYVIVIANLDSDNTRIANPGYAVTGTWYKYNGSTAVDETAYTVNNTADSYALNPSESLILTNFIIDDCTDVRNTLDSGKYSLRDAIDCAADGDTVHIEYPVFNDTIHLLTPIEINKNITILGFDKMNVTIDGSMVNDNVFSIQPGKSVTLKGVKMLCAQDDGNGRCILNNGNLTLDNIKMVDMSGGLMGNSLWNSSIGNLNIKGKVIIVE